MAKKAVLITSGQPSVNPRLVKEADALTDAGYEVIVIYQYWNEWATELDKKLLTSKMWKAIRVAGDPNNEKLTYFISRIIFKAAQLLNFKIGERWILPELAISRSSYFLYKKAKEIQADLYIGHNMGALAPVVWAAKYHKKASGFDAEDFHRHETSDDTNNTDVRLKKYLEEKYFPQLSYLSAASPLIAGEYERLFPMLKVHTILNTFPAAKLKLSKLKRPNSMVKLFWFSQTVGRNRGIEEVLDALSKVPPDHFQLHLLGELRSSDRDYIQALMKKNQLLPESVCFHPPIQADEIIYFASQFDVGLATETGVPYNRNICLTNKIFTYIQAGLAVLASDTDAQKQLLEHYPGIGLLYKRNDVSSLTNGLNNISKSLEIYKKTSTAASKEDLNWEKEATKFLKIANKILNK